VASRGDLDVASSERVEGEATIVRIRDTGCVQDDNPELELVLAVTLPGRATYRARHRQVLSRQVAHLLDPGSVVPVRIDPHEPSRLEIG
jgi:hypothetical protein